MKVTMNSFLLDLIFEGGSLDNNGKVPPTSSNKESAKPASTLDEDDNAKAE